MDDSKPPKPPVDPGCLPAWNVAEMPEPPVMRRSLLQWIGPGIVMAGAATGTGEWVMGPQAAARYQGALLWVVLVSILCQVVLNTEAMRYALCTGEPVMTGFMRCKPGPRFWIPFYILLDFGSWWPAVAGLAAQVLVVAIQGLGPRDPIDPDLVRYVSYGVFLACGFLVLFGGKVYNTLEVVLSGKVLFVVFYMLICTVFFVSFQTWVRIWSGLFDVTRVVRDASGGDGIDWALIAALAGYSGVGGLGNIMVSNFVREKGWGMGQYVGAIPSAFGGHEIRLSHLGTICPSGEKTRRRFRGWWRRVLADQYGIWLVGSLFGMMLPCVLGAEYLRVEEIGKDHWRWAAKLAQDFGAAHGDLFRLLTLICGLVILIPGQYGIVDGVARRWCDTVWSGLAFVRKFDTDKVKYLYYAFAAAYLIWGVSAYTFFPQLSGSQMMQIAGNMANLAIAATIFHTLYVNRRFLPKEVQPSLGKQVLMVIAGLFFLTMFGLVVNDKIVPLLRGG